MMRSLAIVLVLLIFGEATANFASIPVPGSALGLITLAVAFSLRGGPDRGFDELFDFAAPYFPLFFVPAAVGVFSNISMISIEWVSILAAIVGGTTVTLLVTGLVCQMLMRPSLEEVEP